MKPLHTAYLARAVTVAHAIAVMGGAWDIWWHEAVGRDTFFIPPHILLQVGVVVALAIAAYGWYRVRSATWGWLVASLALIPASAPLDAFWHALFGKENLAELRVVWSPPHVMLIAGGALAFLVLLQLVRRDSSASARRLFGSICLAGVFFLTVVFLSPFYPAGPFAIAGFWGAGVLAAVIVAALLVSGRVLPGVGAATEVAALFLLAYVSAVAINEPAAHVIVNPHAHPPAWLNIFAFLAPALWVDFTKRLPLAGRGGVAGAAWAGVLFPFASYFSPPEFFYPLSDALVAVGASVVGGTLAGFFVAALSRRPRRA